MCGDEISTYQTCHSDTRLPFVKLHVCNEEVCETKQLYLCELILINSQDHQFEPVLAPPTTSEQHHLQSDEHIIHQRAMEELHMQLSPD